MVDTFWENPQNCCFKIIYSIFWSKTAQNKCIWQWTVYELKKKKLHLSERKNYFYHNIIIQSDASIVRKHSRSNLQFLIHGICLHNWFPFPYTTPFSSQFKIQILQNINLSFPPRNIQGSINVLLARFYKFCDKSCHLWFLRPKAGSNARKKT